MERDYSSVCETQNEANMLQDADNAITECGLWDWLKEFTPKENEGFMFSSHPNLELINSKLKLLGHHSGSSYGWTLRQMEYIAKHGFQDFKYRCIAHNKYMKSYDFEILNMLINQANSVKDVEYFTDLIEKRIEDVYNDLKDETIEKRFSYTCRCHKERALRGWCGVAGGGVPGCEH